MSRAFPVWATVLFMFLPAVLGLSDAAAQLNPNNIMDSVVIAYRNGSASWYNTLLGFAQKLFWLLVSIEFAWVWLQMALTRQGWDEVVAETIRRVLIVGFFYAILMSPTYFGANIADIIVSSMRQAANAANTAAAGISGIDPSEIFEIGWQLAIKLVNTVSITDPIDSLALAISAAILIIIYALITVAIIIALAEMYIVIYSSVLFFGFFGSRWTREFGINFIRYSLAVGAKLFAIQLLVGIGTIFMHQWAADFEANQADAITMIGVSVIMWMLIKTIPEIIAGIINGSSFNFINPLSSAAATTGAAIGGAVGGATSGAGALTALKEATSYAFSEPPPSYGSARHPAARGLAALGKAALGDFSARLSGDPSAHYGTLGGRMASRIKEMKISESILNQSGAGTSTPNQTGATGSGADNAKKESTTGGQKQERRNKPYISDAPVHPYYKDHPID